MVIYIFNFLIPLYTSELYCWYIFGTCLLHSCCFSIDVVEVGGMLGGTHLEARQPPGGPGPAHEGIDSYSAQEGTPQGNRQGNIMPYMGHYLIPVGYILI